MQHIALIALLALGSGAQLTAGIDWTGVSPASRKYVEQYWSYEVEDRLIHANRTASTSGALHTPVTGYRFATPHLERLAGISYMGHAARLRLVLERARQGHRIHVATIGGSISVGMAAGGKHRTYGRMFMQWLNAAFPTGDTVASGGGATGAEPGRGEAAGSSSSGGSAGGSGRTVDNSGVEFAPQPGEHLYYNGAVGGTESSYMSSCLQHHLPPGGHVDLVLLEYAVNDSPRPQGDWADPQRRAFERLLRKLLRLPSRPAVVLVNMFTYNAAKGRFWLNAERDFTEAAWYYAVPSVSLKAAAVPPGLRGSVPQLALDAIWHGDKNHPNQGGHVVMAELLVTLAMEALQANSRLAAGMSHQHHHQPRGKERSLKSATGLAAASTAVHQAAYHTAAGAATASFFPPAKRQHAMTSAAGTLRPPTGCRRLQAGSMRGGSRGGSAGSNGKGSRSSSTRSSMRTTSGGDEYGGTGGAVGGGAAGDGVIGAGAGAGAGVRRGMEAALRLLESRAYAELPPPLAGPGTNWESDHTTCYINQELQSVVVQPTNGWNWTDESRGKWGWVATEVGMSLDFKVNTEVASGKPLGKGDVSPRNATVILQVAYLRSYWNMGRVEVACVSGCTCRREAVDAFHDDRKVSVTAMANIQVSQSRECVVRLTTRGPGKDKDQGAGQGVGAKEAGGTQDDAEDSAGSSGGGGTAGSRGGGVDSSKKKSSRRGNKFKLLGVVVGEDPTSSKGAVGWLRGATLGWGA